MRIGIGAVGLVAFVGALGTVWVARNADPTSDAIAVDARIELGDVWRHQDRSISLDVPNRTNVRLVGVASTTSCGCVGVPPTRVEIAPQATANIAARLQGPATIGSFTHFVFVTAESDPNWKWTVAVHGVVVDAPAPLPPAIALREADRNVVAAHRFPIVITGLPSMEFGTRWHASTGDGESGGLRVEVVAVELLAAPSARLVVHFSEADVRRVFACRGGATVLRLSHPGLASAVEVPVRIVR